MKKLFVCMVIMLMAVPGIAEQDTLIKGDAEYGGYIGPEARYTIINGEGGFLMGARAGLIYNHFFSLGIAGYGLASNVDADSPYGDRNLMMGYYGLVPEYVFNPGRIVNVALSALIGGGGVRVNDPATGNMNHNMDAFFAAEPQLSFYVNVVKYFRVGVGAGYRFTRGVDRKGLSDSEAGGFTAGLALQFGVF
ncbi:MAG: hypothetical protein EPN93_07695 [Spirochaetes bacterium]|nr:MAG: hypothetical protein EPN93_07695 [Spirochaetota bacterium]